MSVYACLSTSPSMLPVVKKNFAGMGVRMKVVASAVHISVRVPIIQLAQLLRGCIQAIEGQLQPQLRTQTLDDDGPGYWGSSLPAAVEPRGGGDGRGHPAGPRRRVGVAAHLGAHHPRRVLTLHLLVRAQPRRRILRASTDRVRQYVGRSSQTQGANK
jgi:hypothetical protein